MSIPVIAIFDIGKTNKKLFLFDENYAIVFEKSIQLAETTDEDGDPCENIETLKQWVVDSLHEVLSKKEFAINTINFSSYGASFVLINEQGKTVAPLYNYLKPFPEELKNQFYETYGGEEQFSFQTASPVLGHLNSGMQLYRIKHQKPQLYKQVKYALHLPQYLCYLVSGKAYSELTSIGCHTNLWNFQNHSYHDWVIQERINEKLAPIVSSTQIVEAEFYGTKLNIGVGLHDSSAALIPYLLRFQEPFILISTGTWCISLNPFNPSPLTTDELKCDCLCYLQYQGKPVKASRLFAGYEHDQQVKRMAQHYNLSEDYFRSIVYDSKIITGLRKNKNLNTPNATDILNDSPFLKRDLSDYISFEEAYHQLLFDIISQQYISTQLIIRRNETKRIFVDGGFSSNSIYMNLLAFAFPGIEVYAATMAQASAIGAALSIHQAWNTKPLPSDIIELKLYAVVSHL